MVRSWMVLGFELAPELAMYSLLGMFAGVGYTVFQAPQLDNLGLVEVVEVKGLIVRGTGRQFHYVDQAHRSPDALIVDRAVGIVAAAVDHSYTLIVVVHRIPVRHCQYKNFPHLRHDWEPVMDTSSM